MHLHAELNSQWQISQHKYEHQQEIRQNTRTKNKEKAIS
jgi:hypothetical protein